MARTSKEYWADRAAKLEDRAYKKGEALNKKLRREYERAAREIRQKVEAFYGRYAREQGLSYAEARKRLNSVEAREWRKTLGEYVDEINALPDGKAKDKLIADLDMRSYASQQDRLSSLVGQIDMELDRLAYNVEEQMTMTMVDVLEDGYYRKAFDLQQRAGVLSPFARLSTEMVENALTYPWSGADFSTRIWENKRALLFNARQTITQGVIQGQSVAKMSENLANTLGKSYSVAERLIRTETNHFHAEADKLAYGAAGVKEYEFMATLDSRTSEVCADLDGKHFPVKDAQPGTNYPPMHPNCRSTTVEYDPEDAADWAASGQPMPENMTYSEWKKQQDEQSDVETIETPAESGIIETVRATASHKVVNGNDLSGTIDYANSPYDFDIQTAIHAQGFDGVPQVLEYEDFKPIMEQSNFYAERTYSASSKEILDEYQNQLYNGEWYVDCSAGGAQYGQGMYCAACYDLSDKTSIGGIDWEMLHYQLLNKQRGNPFSYTEAITLQPGAKILELPKGEKAAEYISDKFQENFLLSHAANEAEKAAVKSYIKLSDDIRKTVDANALDALYEAKNKAWGGISTKLRREAREAATYLPTGARFPKIKNPGTLAAEMGYDAINAIGHGDSGSYTVILNRTKVIFCKGGSIYGN